jgi:hypothetical protein
MAIYERGDDESEEAFSRISRLRLQVVHDDFSSRIAGKTILATRITSIITRVHILFNLCLGIGRGRVRV